MDGTLNLVSLPDKDGISMISAQRAVKSGLRYGMALVLVREVEVGV